MSSDDPQDRRRFLRQAALAATFGSGAALLASCRPGAAPAPAPPAAPGDPLYPPLPGEAEVSDARLPYGNVRRYGAVGDGKADDTAAFQRARDSVKALRRETTLKVNEGPTAPFPIFLPAGDYLVTQPGALLDASGATRSQGYAVIGEGGGISKIKYYPASSGPLIDNHDEFRLVLLRGFMVECNDRDAGFWRAVSNGGVQYVGWEDLRFVGDWGTILQLTGNANNSEYSFERVNFDATAATAFLDLPAGSSIQNLNFWFDRCELTSNTVSLVRAEHGGHFKFSHCDFSANPNRQDNGLHYLFDLRETAQGLAANNVLEVEHSRMEILNDDQRLLRCAWAAGRVSFRNFNVNYGAKPRLARDTVALFAPAQGAGPNVLFEDCHLIGQHEYVHAAAGSSLPRIRYERCLFPQHRFPDEFLRVVARGGNAGTQPLVEFVGCSSVVALQGDGTGWNDRLLWDFDHGARGAAVAVLRPRLLSLQGADGSWRRGERRAAVLPPGVLVRRLYAFLPAGAGTGAWKLVLQAGPLQSPVTVAEFSGDDLGAGIRLDQALFLRAGDTLPEDGGWPTDRLLGATFEAGAQALPLQLIVEYA